MAEIKMEYRNYICTLDCENACMQCFSSCASDLGCPHFCDGKSRDKERIPYGDCIHAEIKTSYKGVVAKSYEIEEVYDPYEADEYMSVKIRGKYYECDKVILDGVQIYPKTDKEVDDGKT